MPLSPLGDDTPSLPEPVLFSWWFLTGGTAGAYHRRLPSRAAFMRLASERKAAHRWAQAQGAAAARRKEAESTPRAPTGRKPKREELMARFGPGSGVCAGRGLGDILAERADAIAEKLRAAQAPGTEPPPGTAEAPAAQTATGPEEPQEPEEPASRNTPTSQVT